MVDVDASADVDGARADTAPLGATTPPELADMAWLHHAKTFASTSFWAVARRLPAIVREAMALGWAASPRDTMTAVGLNLVAGTMTTLGLVATGNVLRELLADGPTPDRVQGALPALATAAVAVMVRGGLGIAAGWAQARLAPQINYAVPAAAFRDHHRGRAGRL